MLAFYLLSREKIDLWANFFEFYFLVVFVNNFFLGYFLYFYLADMDRIYIFASPIYENGK